MLALPLMYKQHRIRQKFSWFHGAINKQQYLGVLSTAMACFLCAAPAIMQLSENKLLAEQAISQDLKTASLYQQGVTRYNRNDLQGAESAFRLALQRDPNLALARHYLGNILLMQNRLDVAVQEYGEAVRINPNLGETYYNLGLALHRQGQKEAAITAYRQALVIDPNKTATHYNLGLALYELGRIEEAIAAYQEAIKLDRSNAKAQFNLAITRQGQGKIEEAIAAYKQVIEIDPKNDTAYNNLGSLKVIQGDPEQAIAVYRQAIRQNPENASAYYNLGVLLYNLGELKKANQLLNRAYTAYQQQGELQEAEKVEKLKQQITDLITEQELQALQTPTTEGELITPGQVVVETIPSRESDSGGK